MAKEYKDNSLRLAATAVSATLIIAFGGALVVRSAVGVVLIMLLEAAVLIGTGLLLRKMPSDRGH